MASMPVTESVAPIYPTSDGKPMAENETQGRQITRLAQQLDLEFADRPDVHVGFDLLWYPVQGHPEISRAPDIFVVPGRPQDPLRQSWLQWNEDDAPMRHVVEILSPANSGVEMIEKRRFYERYGVEEYLVFDPGSGSLEVHVRTDLGLVPITAELPWRSELLEGRSYRVDPLDAPGVDESLFDLILLDHRGEVVETHTATIRRAHGAARRADQQAQRADQEAQRADQEAQRADWEAARSAALEAQLQAAGIEPAG